MKRGKSPEMPGMLGMSEMLGRNRGRILPGKKTILFRILPSGRRKSGTSDGSFPLF